MAEQQAAPALNAVPLEPSLEVSDATSRSLELGTLTVLMPIYNERHTLQGLLDRIRAVPVSKEIVIVDDASTDGTRDYLRTQVEGKYPDVRVFYHARNQGKGMAIRTAIPHATGDYCIVQDGDLEYHPEDYLPILRAFREQQADVVYGSRFQHGWPKMRPANRLINILLAWMVRFFFRMPMTDEATCYKAFRTDVLQSIPLTCRRFEFCPEITAKVIRRGHRIVEVTIRYEARSMAEGKKIRWTDGPIAIWTLLKFRFARF
jgi:dolichol-phosphate mannosyltransferase